MGNRMRMQSAIEYLTTYGWAILIIAIVIVALFALKLINPGTQSQCFLTAGFTCQTLTMTENGLLTINLFQATQNPVIITSIECNSNNQVSSTYIYVPSSPVTIYSAQNHTFTPIQCWANGQKFTSPAGGTYQGSLLINYTEQYTGFKHVIYGKIIVSVS